MADSTGVWTQEGWVYGAIVLDVSRRLVIGWTMAARRADDVVLTAVRMALAHRQPQAGLLHHADRGSQYTSSEYQALLARWDIPVSMSSKGACDDNAMLASLNATLKGECTDRRSWQTHAQARQAIFEFSEIWYDRQRPHSALGSGSPMAYEQMRA